MLLGLVIAACNSTPNGPDLTARPAVPVMPESSTPRYSEFSEFARHYVESTPLVLPRSARESADEVDELAEYIDLDHPYMSRLDAAGNLYILEKGKSRVLRLDSDAKLSVLAGANEFDSSSVPLETPTGLAVMADGRCFVFERAAARIQRIGHDGGISTLLVDPEPTPMARGLWVAPDEQLVYYTAGTRLRRWRKLEGSDTLATDFVSLADVDVAPDGAIYVSDSGGNRVYRIDSDGTALAVAGNGTAQGGGHGQRATQVGLHGARGLVALGGGALVVGTQHGQRLWFIDKAGYAHLILDPQRASPVPGLGGPNLQLGPIRGLSLAINGDLLVTHGDIGRIHRLRHEF